MPPSVDKDVRSFDFVMGFLENSKKYKAQFIDKWEEILANFIVDPEDFGTGTVDRPYARGQRKGLHRNKGIILKDAETHKAIMTYASKLVGSVISDPRGEYIRAKPVGWEDAQSKSPTVTKLLRYAFGLPGHFRTMVEAVVDMLLFGTAVIEIPWVFQEREQLVRDVFERDGILDETFTRQSVETYNDVRLNVLDVQDFYPDPSRYIIEDMVGVAKKFKTTALEARANVESGRWKKSAVESAINNSARKDERGADAVGLDEVFREGIDQPEYRDQVGDFTPMIGFEYWGSVPWADDQGSSRRVITLLNNEVVRDIPYPLADGDLPFRSMTINPVVGRFYGVSPAEVIRWDQSLQDAVKILLAEAIIRQVHPPLAYDTDSEIDLAKLRGWSPDIPIGIRGGPNNIGTVKYDAQVFNGFQLTAMEKQAMQEASGALGIIQGQGLGTKRASATEAQITTDQALSRPEMAAALLERDALPLIAKSILRRYQQFLEDDEALTDRVGQLPQPTWIGDIMGDFDIQFVGSRMSMSRQQKLQAYDRLLNIMSSVPQAGAMIPLEGLLANMIGEELELPEVAAMIANPEVMQKNILLNQLMQAGQGAGNGNQTNQRSEPSGLIPAQASGGVGG